MITKEQLKHLAKLAKIDFDENELEKFFEDIKKILEYVNEIQELNLDDYEPMIGGPVQKIYLREDIKKITPESTKEKIIELFPDKKDNFLKVPKILEK